MTRNNLREHLTWLIASNPSYPPPPKPGGRLPLTDFPGTSFEESLPGTNISHSRECPNNGDSGLEEGEGHSDNQRRSELQVPVFSSDETMVRLQSGLRSSNKPRLLSQPIFEPSQTPKAFQALATTPELRCPTKTVREEKSYLHTLATTTCKAPLTKAIPQLIDLSSEGDAHHSSSSAEEVFGEPRQIWREDSASRKEPLVKKGKKRKSDEFELGLTVSQSSFTAVEAFPEEAPPPYSETFEDPACIKAGSRKNIASRPATVGKFDIQGEHLNGSPVLNNAPKIIKQDPLLPARKFSTPGEILPEELFGGRDRSEAAEYESLGARKKPKRSIADSEDENDELSFEELDETFWLDKKPGIHHNVSDANYPVLPKITNSLNARSDHAHFQSQFQHVATDCTPCETLSTKISNDPSPFHRDSPTKLTLTQVQQTPQVVYSTSETAQLTSAERASVKIFLATDPELIQNYHEGLLRARRTAAETVYSCFERQEIPTPEMQHQMTSLKAKLDATQALVQLRESYNALCKHKEELKSRLIDAIREDRPASSYLENKNYAAERLAQMEKNISSLLVQAAIPLQEPNVSCQGTCVEIPIFSHETNKPSRLLVKSTQAPQNLDDIPAPRERVPVPSSSSTNQYIQQTPNIDRTPGTPRQQYFMSNSAIQRSPLQTYMSCPKATDITAYGSPSKRKPRQDSSEKVDARQGNVTDPAVDWPPPLSMPSRKSARIHGQEEEQFSRNMASPLRMVVDEEDYGQEEDDDDMLEAAEEFEKYGTRPLPNGPTPQGVFAESSGNIIRAEPRKEGLFLSGTHTQASHMQHPWSREVKAAMKERFHLRGFRPNQLEAINATLSGKDTFVLMPTGGGKSLCYQLPSIVRSGKTRGVTVVISPLLSLMQDQVEHLKELKIQAFLINSEVSREHRALVMESLREPQVEKYIQLLYITPEMISKSQAMVRAFRELYERKKLARIVIDEAHCVSEWGHDFRPDYKLLGDVRREFSGVPVMALTATATENAKVDVIHNLGIQGCEVLTQSFNRPNLTYEVRSKGKGKEVLETIATTIKTFYNNQSGIIYCFSRQNCETVAKSLREVHQISAQHYHAGMDAEDKNSAQRKWQSGKYHVIVATIAFGMGIDKPDVRFVIHHSIPKSLEGYYQETGRAGRDGKRSGCYLYYGYQDAVAIKRIIDEGEGSFEQKERQRQMLRNVIGFCENKSDCRRVQVLRYFNESFRREDCNGACDNCTSQSSFETQDYTEYAVAAIALVKRVEKSKVTLLHCVDVFRGGKSKKIAALDHGKLPEYGAGSHLERGDVERLFYRLLSEGALAEKSVVNKKSGFPARYLHPGPNCHLFVRGGKKVKIQIRVSPRAKRVTATTSVKNRGTGPCGPRPDYPLSTNVSSPIQAASRRRVAEQKKPNSKFNSGLNGYACDEFVLSDNGGLDSEDESDYFESIREAGKPEKSKIRKLGPPITIDEKLNGVDSSHRLVIEDFLFRAKKESDDILVSKNLRAHPFTDTVLREMAINFPQDKKEMCDIPGIDPDKVERYGHRFLKLIRSAQRGYYEMKQQQENSTDDPPEDPNHRNVINISSEDEFADDCDLEDFVGDDGPQEERSTYFQATPDVDAFNARFSHIETVGTAQPRAQSPNDNLHVRNNGRSSYGGGYRGGGGKSGYRKKSRKSSTGVVQSKVAAKTSRSGYKSTGASKTSHNYNAGAEGSKRQHGGGGGGIGMMPT